MNTNQKSLDKKKTKELDWPKAIQNSVNRQIDLITIFYSLKTPQDLEKLLTQQRTELEQQKVKVVWNSVCEQIKKDTIEQILNLECLKEEYVYPDSCCFDRSPIRNALRKEIKEEINNLLKKHETIQNKK